MLKLNDVHCHYGSIHAIKGISFDLRHGQIGCLIGANGAGKSTVLSTVSGLQRPTQGVIEFEGVPIHGASSDQIVRMGICQVPEGRRIFPRMTVRENLLLGAYIRRDRAGIRQDMQRVFDYFPVLAERLTQEGGTLSGGQQQMLAVGRALMARPKLLLLDEPSLGLAPFMVQTIFDIIKGIAGDNITVLLVEQNARAALKLAHYGWVLDLGRIVLADSADNLLHNPRVAEAYLGQG
ncbi:branched-chain amino acid abc transporter ATP-binding protein [Candidatus Magnetobacterium bavaricum]|uniref:Branched-chain amino acid abc transporter ATP-binding protein n=1 Tax=Candidatus Magnetobacterium bavaricum TaxID=29290 RepID=A0A0F3GPI2_9BACT|nr:branched-chain amino acid abc transporter ATP-binding protein [Candidatus Magnetobacterium bavaricum]